MRLFLIDSFNFSTFDKINSSAATFLTARNIYLEIERRDFDRRFIHQLIHLSDRIFNFYTLGYVLVYFRQIIYRLISACVKREREIILLEKQDT